MATSASAGWPFAEHSRLMIAISRYSADRSRMTGKRRRGALGYYGIVTVTC